MKGHFKLERDFNFPQPYRQVFGGRGDEKVTGVTQEVEEGTLTFSEPLIKAKQLICTISFTAHPRVKCVKKQGK